MRSRIKYFLPSLCRLSTLVLVARKGATGSMGQRSLKEITISSAGGIGHIVIINVIGKRVGHVSESATQSRHILEF
jgi:hypothetical protein